MKSDRQIQKDIMEELSFNPAISAEAIGVAVQDGVATLTGKVSSVAEKFSVEKTCFRVFGVKALADELEVVLPGQSLRTDTDIAKAAAHALTWNVLVPPTVEVTVEKGWVMLRGTVEMAFQRKAAEKAVRNLTGITGVTNHINIQTKVSPSDVKEKIEHALRRSANDDAQRIHVEVLEGRVVLSGTVNSPAEIEDAKWAAWAVPGVTDIESRLRIA